MFSSPSTSVVRAAGPVLLVLLAARNGAAQERERPVADGAPRQEGAPAVWNSAQALTVARAAIDARRRATADPALESYLARAEGHVYFLGEFSGERQLVRADQIALRIAWRAPARSEQTIVGRRHEKRLPTRIRYHIDHLSVVLDNLGDRIRLGEGDEVRHVLHPAAPGAIDFYDYRLADSLEIRVRDRTVRVHELEVRPTRSEDPGVVGALFVERSGGGIARMAVTFTSAAYVDRDLDYIRLDLRSALWEGRHWLPADQEVEIRRQVSWLSYPVGGIIRTRFRIFDYRLNADVPTLPPGDRVTALPPATLGAYDEWRAGLHAGPLAAAERDDETLAALERRARGLVRPATLSGTSRWQLHLPDASGALRARRAEGVLAGAGARFGPDDRTGVGVWAAWPFARERPEARLDLEVGLGKAALRASLFANRLADVGPWAAAPGLLSTLAFAIDGEDWTDPYFENGGELAVEAPLAGGRAILALRAVEQDSARLVATALGSADARPVRPIEAGTMGELRLELRRRLGRGLGARWEAGLTLGVAAAGIGDFGYTRALARLEADGGDREKPWSWSAEAGAGIAGGTVPPQRLILLGGRGTVPGYPFRGWGGDRAAWGRVEVARDALAPWIRVRAHAALGGAGLGAPGRSAADRLGLTGSDGIRPAVGGGAGILWDILRFDVWRGLDEGDWTLLFSVDPAYWKIL